MVKSSRDCWRDGLELSVEAHGDPWRSIRLWKRLVASHVVRGEDSDVAATGVVAQQELHPPTAFAGADLGLFKGVNLMFRSVLRLLLSVAFYCPVLLAAPPSLERLQPAAGQRGTTFTLSITGAGLQQVSEVLLYNPGIRCESLRAASDNALEVTLAADAALPPGPQAFRLRSPEGLSELLTFQLTVLPVVSEQEDNNTAADAQSVPLNSTIVGVVTAADADCFRVWLAKGQRLSVEAEAMRAGGAMFDAVINLYDEHGAWLSSIDDTPLTRQDPWLSFTAPEEGDYIVEIHEASFEGDDDSRYALHVGDFPRPATVWPPGGQAGTRTAVAWQDVVTGQFTQEVELPGRGDRTIQLYPERDGVAGPVGVPFRVFSGANRTEDLVDSAEVAELPIAFNGRLAAAEETDCWRFRGAAGERVRIEVWAARVGSAADTLLEVRSADGRLIAASDDEESHDSAVNAYLPTDGVYEVRIREKRGRGGADCFYRIEAAIFQPSITAFISRPDRRSQERQAVSVPRGNRVVTYLSVQRRGFSGAAALAASGLPAGVELQGAAIPEDRFWVPMVMQASADAPLGGTLVDIEASGSHGNQLVSGHFLQRVDLVAASADQLFHAAEVDRLAVAVTDAVPYSAELEVPRIPLAVNGTLTLRVRVHRTDDFAGPLEVSFPFLPPWVDGPDKLVIRSEEDTGDYVLRAWPQAEPRTWQLCAEVRPALAVREDAALGVPREPGARRLRERPVARTSVATSLVPVTIAQSPVSAETLRIVTEQGRNVRAVVRPKVHGRLPEQLTASVEGLPNRVSSKAIFWDGRQPELVFEIVPEETAPLGEFADIQVRVSGVLDGQPASWLVAGGSVLQLESPGGLVLDAAGRPLSRLEKLRRDAATVSATESGPEKPVGNAK